MIVSLKDSVFKRLKASLYFVHSQSKWVLYAFVNVRLKNPVYTLYYVKAGPTFILGSLSMYFKCLIPYKYEIKISDDVESSGFFQGHSFKTLPM